jgi:fibronectin type 3 domain-containing protein
VSVTPQDSIAPAPPAGLVAVPGERDVALTWRANREPDLLGYLVYRRELPQVVSVRLTDQTIPGTTFTDRTARRGATYVYTVTAVDRSARRNESAPSAEVEVSLP